MAIFPSPLPPALPFVEYSFACHCLPWVVKKTSLRECGWPKADFALSSQWQLITSGSIPLGQYELDAVLQQDWKWSILRNIWYSILSSNTTKGFSGLWKMIILPNWVLVTRQGQQICSKYRHHPIHSGLPSVINPTFIFY